jgi:hypothetical protein
MNIKMKYIFFQKNKLIKSQQQCKISGQKNNAG